MAYDSIKSHKKAGFHPLFRKYIFGKTTGEGQIEPLPVLLGLKFTDEECLYVNDVVLLSLQKLLLTFQLVFTCSNSPK